MKPIIDTTIIEIGPYKLDIGNKKLFIESRFVSLTNKEFLILEYLMKNKGIVISRKDIYYYAWNSDFDSNSNPNSYSNVVDVHIKNLRRKIKFGKNNLIKTVRGIGYVIEK